MKKWEKLPPEMQTEEVRYYYDILQKKRFSLAIKRLFDIVASACMLVVFSPIMLVTAIAIKLDSPGPVFFRQERVTQYNKHFRIFKFRSMAQDSEKNGQLTVIRDSRITRVGKYIRDNRLDEFGQLIDILRGTMSFVGTRPEVPRYVAHYTPEMMATLLLPAGVTSLTSLYYANESRLLSSSDDVDKTYIEEILPQKMYFNLKGIEEFSLWGDVKLMFMTVFALFGKEYKYDERDSEKADNAEKEKCGSAL